MMKDRKSPLSKSKGSSSKLLFFIFSLIVSISIFTVLFTEVSWKQVLQLIREVDQRALIAFFGLSFGMSFFRSWRYLVLLRALGHEAPKVRLFFIVIVRNFFADLLPARLGTTIYIYLVNSRLHIPFAAASATASPSSLALAAVSSRKSRPLCIALPRRDQRRRRERHAALTPHVTLGFGRGCAVLACQALDVPRVRCELAAAWPVVSCATVVASLPLSSR